jgi:hypothetical protein
MASQALVVADLNQEDHELGLKRMARLFGVNIL